MYRQYQTSEELMQLQETIAKDSLERYSGSHHTKFCRYLLITNFPEYVTHFAKKRSLIVTEGSAFRAAHSTEEDISILDFKIGSPAAALTIDCCAFLPIRAALHLGMCGGLRRNYSVGDYFVPIASIRGEGTSDFYFPPEVPAMANFLVQKAVTNVLEKQHANYHIGICHTTNKRFWEFNPNFIERIKVSRAQAIDMESATLFCASYKFKLPTGGLYLISDLPLNKKGIKTKASSKHVHDTYTDDHIEKGVTILKTLRNMVEHNVKGASREDETE